MATDRQASLKRPDIFPSLECQIDEEFARSTQTLSSVLEWLRCIESDLIPLKTAEDDTRLREFNNDDKPMVFSSDGRPTAPIVLAHVRKMIEDIESALAKGKTFTWLSHLHDVGFYDLMREYNFLRPTECGTCNQRGWTFEMPCGISAHALCYLCVKQYWTISLDDLRCPFPPGCCGGPLRFQGIENFFDRDLAKTMRVKILERTASAPIWCRHCNTFLTSVDRLEEEEFANITCHKCDGRTCVACREVAHDGECLEDTSTREVIALAKEKKWSKCVGCGQIIEKQNGCNHMRCHCGQEYCYICFAAWGTCSCSLFTDEELPARPVRMENEPAHLSEDLDWSDADPDGVRYRSWANLILLIWHARRRDAVTHPVYLYRSASPTKETRVCNVCGTTNPTFTTVCGRIGCNWQGCDGCFTLGAIDHHDLPAGDERVGQLGPEFMTDLTLPIALDLTKVESSDREAVPETNDAPNSCSVAPLGVHLYQVHPERHECRYCGQERRVRLRCLCCGISTCVCCDYKNLGLGINDRDKFLMTDCTVEQKQILSVM